MARKEKRNHENDFACDRVGRCHDASDFRPDHTRAGARAEPAGQDRLQEGEARQESGEEDPRHRTGAPGQVISTERGTQKTPPPEEGRRGFFGA
jgi:hypothetical protein